MIELFAPYDGQSTCDPTPKPGAIMFRDHVLRWFGGTDLGIARACNIGGTSEHKEGRAWDWGVLSGDPRVNEMLSWLLDNDAENARGLGVMYLIYDRRAWRSYRDPHWGDYRGASPHLDHIHISFSRKGGAGLTSLYQPGALDASMGEESKVSKAITRAFSFLTGLFTGALFTRKILK